MKSASTIAAIAAVLALASSPAHVDAHGGMTSPESRAIRTMKLAIASTFGHPINMRGDYTNGKGGDCINFTPDTNLQSIPVGSSKIKMRANDGANHVGQCSVFLIDPQDKNKKLQVGQMKDCMRSLHPGPGNKGDQPIPAEMTIDVPSSGLPCRDGHCVLQFAWEAQHVTPSEFYNNCADVKITGASSAGDNDSGNDKPVSTPKPAATPKPVTMEPSVTPKPSKTTKPAATEPATKEPVTKEPATKKPATKEPATPAATSKPVVTKPAATPTSKTPAVSPAPASKTPSATTKPSSDCKAKKKFVGSTPDMTQWCNWNCPNFCPEDLCKET